MGRNNVPAILMQLYREAAELSDDPENRRYRLALLGLVNAFKSDLERKSI